MYYQVYHSGAKKGKVEENGTGVTDLYWYSVQCKFLSKCLISPGFVCIPMERRFTLYGECRKIVFSSPHCSKLSGRYRLLYIILLLIQITDLVKTIYVYLWHCIRLQQTKKSTQLGAIPCILYWVLPCQWQKLVENLTKSGVSVRKKPGCLLTLSIRLKFICSTQFYRIKGCGGVGCPSTNSFGKATTLPQQNI